MNVIDSLVLELGLNSKQFTDGIRGATDSLASFTLKALALAGVVTSIEGVVNYFKDLEQHLAEVGYQARNLGVAGAELSRLGEVSRLMGGQAEDATASVQGLQSAIFNLQYRGQMSDQLAMLQRFGVAYLTASGHARDFKAIAMDAAHVMDRQIAAGMDEGTRLQLAMSFGLQGGEAAAVAGGSAQFQEKWAQASADQAKASSNAIDAARQIDVAFTRTSAVIAANSSAILEKLAPDLIHLTEWVRRMAEEYLPKIPAAIDGLKEFLRNPPEWLTKLEGDFDGLKKTFHDPPPWLQTLERLFGGSKDTPAGDDKGDQSASSASGNAGTISEAIIAALGWGRLALGMGGKLVPYVSSALLLEKLVEKIAPKGFDDWLNSGSLLPGAEPFGTGKSALGGFGDWLQQQVDQYNAHPHPRAPWEPGGGFIPAPNTPPPLLAMPSLPPAPPTPNAPRPVASGSAAGPPSAMNRDGITNHIQIDSIAVQTRSTDAYGMASDMRDALNRKLMVANADLGQV